jgi:hypothetical protein
MSCPHPSNIRHVHIASQVFPDANTVIRDERCLCCDTLLSVTYVNGVETSAVAENDTPVTLDVLPPLQPLPVEDLPPADESNNDEPAQ